ncbi:MAG: lectin-like protein, partial [Flexibacteraceae bacterium]
EYFGHSIRKITPAGVVSNFAGGTGGTADGTGAAAQFNNPTSVAVGPNGNVYVTDQTNNRIRQITPAGVVTTLAGSSGGFADGTGSSAQFSAPTGIAVDYNGNIFVADYYNHRIRKITPTGVVTTFAGNGTGSSTDGIGTAATFHNPRGIVIDGSGTLFVTCEGTDRIRRITNPGAVVTTIAGANSGISVPNSANSYIFNNPVGLTIDANGVIYQAELSSPRILKLTPCSDIATPNISGSNVICSGNPVVLTSSSATGNIWSNGATTQSITVSAAGTYSVLVASNGCASASASVTVTANDLRTNPRTIAGFTYFTTVGNKDYYRSTTPTTWTAARTNCIAAGGDLASLETEAEWTAVRTAAGNSEFLWIGLSDAAVEGQFQWVSGAPFNYTIWSSGEPNNYGGDEDYGGLVNGLANDFPTNQNLNAILEVTQTTSAFSNSPVIAGNSLTFSAPTVSGASYSWTGPNGFTSTAQNPTI